MRSKSLGWLTRSLALGAALFVLLPTYASAQRGHGRGKPSDVFVNGHDARDGRTDGRGPRTDQWQDRDDRRRDDDDWDDRNDRRRERRRERRRDRRDDRWDDRNDRRNDRRDDNWGGWGRNGGYGNNGGYYGPLRQTALNAGYNEGIKEGRKDRRNGDRYDYRDEGDYRSADKDYSSRLGDRSTYQRYFRQGFANGYRDGWNGY